MSIIKKIFTAIRGGTREVGEAIIDKNSVRIFEQEIKDADNALIKAKQDLTIVVANEIQASRKINDLQKEITQHKAYVKKALEKNEETLALEVAQKIAEFETEINAQETIKANFAEHALRLKEMIKQTDKALAQMKHELVIVKSTQSVQKSTKNITQNYAFGTSTLLKAKESLDRVKRQQQDFDNRLKAGELLKSELGERNLEKKLEDAGITQTTSSALTILNNIKSENTNGPSH